MTRTGFETFLSMFEPPPLSESALCVPSFLPPLKGYTVIVLAYFLLLCVTQVRVTIVTVAVTMAVTMAVTKAVTMAVTMQL